MCLFEVCANDAQARRRLRSSCSFNPSQKLTRLAPLFEINSADFFPQIASGVLTSNVGVRVHRFFGLSGRVPFEVLVDVQLVACM